MSTLEVKVVEIGDHDVRKHPNADRLDLVMIGGWQCVAQTAAFGPGDKAIYIPIDSILPHEVESMIFGPDSKVKLSKSRVKTIKLRGAISQGLLVKPEQVGLSNGVKVGLDVMKDLGITKWEPPTKGQAGLAGGNASNKRNPHPDFAKYTKIENVKNYVKLFEEHDEVIVTEKIHGTNFRAGYVLYNADTWWKKIKKFFRAAPKYEFVYGSHNVQLQDKFLYKGFYDKNVYAEAVVRYDLKNVLEEGEVLYGEIYGDGVQKNYKYGCKPGERKFVAFDLMKKGEYMSSAHFFNWCCDRDIPRVKALYKGPFDYDKIKALLTGNSVMHPEQKVIEGGVCKPASGNEKSYQGRKALKFINDEYLLKDNSDFH